MRKIAIISAYAYIEHHGNYGSLLQYYALQTFLEQQFGCDPYWIRYTLPEEHSLKYEIKDLIKTLFFSFDRNRKKLLKKQGAFAQQYLKLSKKKYCGFDEITNNPPKADLYITGSDQVWGGCIEANYLRFVEPSKPKMAYAASFGRSELSKEQLMKVPDWIREIDYVSLREKEGVKICEDLDIPAIMVADPTLLIKKEQYPVIEPKDPPDYFCYFLNKFSLDREVDSLVRNSNAVFCSGVNKNASAYKEYEKVLSPEEWIGMIKCARFVLTNSFHGMIFSIIFRKPFIVFLQDGKTELQNSRIYSFLSYIDLEDRIYKSPEQLTNFENNEVGWNKAYKKIDSLCHISTQFIQEALY